MKNEIPVPLSHRGLPVTCSGLRMSLALSKHFQEFWRKKKFS